jgi:hypothetical protein
MILVMDADSREAIRLVTNELIAISTRLGKVDLGLSRIIDMKMDERLSGVELAMEKQQKDIATFHYDIQGKQQQHDEETQRLRERIARLEGLTGG